MIIYAVLSILIILTLAVFYLIIRIKDIRSNTDSLSAKFPLTEEMRKQTSDAITSINKEMAVINQKAQQINDVMNEVKNLRNLFIAPKGAGAAGERILEKALQDVLGSNMLESQYRLSSGVVDFVIKFKEHIVPIDSKLSLENFNKMLTAGDDNVKRAFWKAFTGDVKKRIDETSKYILPGENTTDFAMMYIPSEGVYYEAFVKDKHFNEENTLIDYAWKRRVCPVSPQTIYPYLVMIVQGMKALRIEENAKEILGKVSGLKYDFDRFKDIYNVLMKHIKDAYNNNDSLQNSMAKIDQHIASLEQKSA
ncbi:MAG: DNA recombination protein RmuC [Candidatus Omnitrophica bacterium]|nr:DNA recombination protein RmuC [Candidatus Omnitrophota bacterium]